MFLSTRSLFRTRPMQSLFFVPVNRFASNSIVDDVKADHNEVSSMIDKWKATKSTTERATLTDKIARAVIQHSNTEHMVLYPAVKKWVPDGSNIVQHNIDEHTSIEKDLMAVYKMDAADAEFSVKFQQFCQDLQHHVKEEEQPDGVLNKLERAVDAETLKELSIEWESKKKLASEQPHLVEMAQPKPAAVVGNIMNRGIDMVKDAVGMSPSVSAPGSNTEKQPIDEKLGAAMSSMSDKAKKLGNKLKEEWNDTTSDASSMAAKAKDYMGTAMRSNVAQGMSTASTDFGMGQKKESNATWTQRGAAEAQAAHSAAQNVNKQHTQMHFGGLPRNVPDVQEGDYEGQSTTVQTPVSSDADSYKRNIDALHDELDDTKYNDDSHKKL